MFVGGVYNYNDPTPSKNELERNVSSRLMGTERSVSPSHDVTSSLRYVILMRASSTATVTLHAGRAIQDASTGRRRHDKQRHNHPRSQAPTRQRLRHALQRSTMPVRGDRASRCWRPGGLQKPRASLARLFSRAAPHRLPASRSMKDLLWASIAYLALCLARICLHA